MAVEGAARALWACSVSRAGRTALLRASGLEMVGGLLGVARPSLLVPVVGVLHQCVAEVRGLGKKLSVNCLVDFEEVLCNILN